MRFNLETKTYKDEIYSTDLGQRLSAVVVMHFHTHYKSWDVMYTIRYPPHYQTEHIFEKGNIKSRKEARLIAQQVMDNARPDDWKTKLSEFYKKLIRESLPITPHFVSI